MRGGDLDRRVTFMAPGTVVDGEFGPQPGAPTVFAARVPAQVLDMLPRHAETQDQVLRLADRPARLVVRYLRGVTSDMFVIVHGETDTKHQIDAGPAEIGRREWLEMTIKGYTS